MLPFLQELVLALDYLCHQPPLVRSFDADEIDRFGSAIGTRQVDLRLPRPGDMDVRRFMICRVDNDPETMGAVNDNHTADLT